MRVALVSLKGAEIMDSLVKILDSFRPGWKERKHIDRFIAILKEMVIPTYSLLHARIENNRAVFSEEWSRIISALREAQLLSSLYLLNMEVKNAPTRKSISRWNC